MSRSAGTGSPTWFACSGERAERAVLPARVAPRKHEVVLTGRTRPARDKPGSARGLRSSDTNREYRCSTCGHLGWSNHIDLERRSQREDR
jgi:hypothetical protein